ncbi:MAG: type IV secretory system conjugative DNA transfer family protein, partial [Desulfobacteraceae bacterium]|nr:type IV secretory system conjugative DNA transfer family protein [Desulfobacteraceae bacterium]
MAVKNNKYIRMNNPLSVLVYAPPGSGKTAGIIIPSLISCSNSAVVHDSKGELYAKTHKRRGEFSKVIKFSPGEEGSLKWNPLSKEELPNDWADIEVHVDRVAQTLIPDNPKNPGEHWPKAARGFFMFWALYLIHKDGHTSPPAISKAPLQTDDIKGAIRKIIEDYKGLPERAVLEGNG